SVDRRGDGARIEAAAVALGDPAQIGRRFLHPGRRRTVPRALGSVTRRAERHVALPPARLLGRLLGPRVAREARREQKRRADDEAGSHASPPSAGTSAGTPPRRGTGRGTPAAWATSPRGSRAP